MQHRPRVNQPVGFLISQALRPSYYYGRRHDYVYYPESWTDSASGTSYEKGYYDENGQHYDYVSFPKDGKYENVVCHCPYCGSDTVLNLSADNPRQDLQCPHCGGPMEIQTPLDDYLNESVENTHTYASEESLRPFTQQKKKKRRWPWILAIFLALGIYGSTLEDEDVDTLPYSQTVQSVDYSDGSVSNTELFGQTIYLTRHGAGAYALSDSGASSADKVLKWDSSADSYYDESSDCWIWCNTDVDPYVWQYWYEGISSDYGDYGWMEHYSDGWFIESSPGNWIELPSNYSIDSLWYIENGTA